MSANRPGRRPALLILCLFVFLSYALTCHADPEPNRAPSFAPGAGWSGGGGGLGGSGTVLPDLFTGTMSYSIPIEVVPGRKGMQPNLALSYRSNNGNGWVGVGWDLEIGAIERSTTNGIAYNDTDSYVLRLNGAAIDLVYDSSNGFYRAKIEGAFFKVVRNSSYWDVYDKSGTHYTFGSTDDSRQYDPYDSSKVFKWCLNRVEDTNGNYTTYSYYRDQGQIYLDRIDYTGNSATGAGTTNYVKFYLEDRIDAPEMYGTNFKVVTAKRLKTIYVSGNGNPVRAYSILYVPYSANTGRSLLVGIQRFGKDVQFSSGAVTGGSALPPVTFEWYNDSSAFIGKHWISPGYWDIKDQNTAVVTGDFNGDGKTDLAWRRSLQSGWKVNISTGDGFTGGEWTSPGGWDFMDQNTSVVTGDFNGDGKTDIAWRRGGWTGWQVNISTGTGFSGGEWTSPGGWDVMDQNTAVVTGDFNGDGKTDIAWRRSAWAGWRVNISTGSGFTDGGEWTSPGGWGDMDQNTAVLTGDFNGDGKTDIAWRRGGWTGWQVNISTGSGFTGGEWTSPGGWDVMDQNTAVVTGDFNGDGKTDIAWRRSTWTGWQVNISTGNGFTGGEWTSPGYWDIMDQNTSVVTGDFNGDGKTDIAWRRSLQSGWKVNISRGDRFTGGEWTDTANWDYMDQNTVVVTGDFDGDGKTEIAWRRSAWTTWEASKSTGAASDLLSQISNGLGGSTSITYLPSTQYANTLLPFPVQTVSSVRTFDGNYATSTTSYTYSGGFFHISDRDFRGFHEVTATGPQGPNGKQLITKTWYHQGNEKDVIPEDATSEQLKNFANVGTGYMKGKPYRTRVSETGGAVYTETETTYLADDAAPYFNPPVQVDVYTCDGKTTGVCQNYTSAKHVKTVFEYYAPYGNLTRIDEYGDVSDTTDDRTVIRWYATNSAKWIIGLLGQEVIYQGTYPGGAQVSFTNYYYDGASDCNTASTNWSPTQGNLTRIVHWNDAVQTRMAYDPYGNLSCTRDPNGNTTTFGYDSTFTYLKTATSPTTANLPDGLTTTTKYYGIDVPADVSATGLYGQVQRVIDPNNQTTLMEYDTFGRKTSMSFPDGTSTSWAYNSFGTVGTQNVQVSASVGVNTWTYFDGFGRTTKQERTGPGGSKVAATARYNSTGTVAESSIPYFANSVPNPLPTYVYEYDALGRTTRVINPDNTTVQACYNNGVIDSIDADQHRKRQTRDAFGRLVQVDEYTGTSASCADLVGTTLYATTNYAYDVMGNLLAVWDEKDNKTEMQYDKLNRKTYMKDPDMGGWSYTYYPNGNLESQTDAEGQTITFQYDALNRVTKKDYPTGTDVEYKYDEPGHTNALGRLTIMTDATGTTSYNYNNMGRPTTTQKTVDGTTYSVILGYSQGRLDSVTYPDGDIVRYAYGAGSELQAVKNAAGNYIYAYYNGHNALGQPTLVNNGNGVATTYHYNDKNYRLTSITASGSGQVLMSLAYDYFPGGNIKGITDPNMPSVSSPGIEVTYSHTGTRPHAVTSSTDGYSFQYDANGNMKSDGTRTINYDYDNMPTSVTIGGNVTSFTYDGNGTRVKKTSSNGTNTYIGKLYECNAVGCTKYIFAGGTRIASKFNGEVLYYHQDHLGSTRVVTEDVGVDLRQLSYYPFGETQSITGPEFTVTHQYTSQEFDAETGLYNYNARLYNPALGRFISPDIIIPDPTNPQAFNRYAYVQNNPLRYTDPSGHFRVSWKEGSRWERDTRHQSERAAETWNKNRDDITAGAIIVGTAAATWYCGGCGAAAMLQGALVGEVIGGYHAKRSGGNLVQGVIRGGVIGGATGALFGTASVATKGMNPLIQIGTKGVIGGAISESLGGTFQQGFIYASVAATAYWGYTEMVGTAPYPLPGKNDLPNGVYDPGANGGQPPVGSNVVGFNDGQNGFWSQGGPVSNVGNAVPGINATAGLHDYWMNQGTYNMATNVGTMFPAAVVSYSALLSVPLSPLLMEQAVGNSNGF